jgi:hypothetical protein
MKKAKKIHSYLIVYEYYAGHNAYSSYTIIDKSAKCKTRGEALLFWKSKDKDGNSILNILELD